MIFENIILSRVINQTYLFIYMTIYRIVQCSHAKKIMLLYTCDISKLEKERPLLSTMKKISRVALRALKYYTLHSRLKFNFTA